MIVQDPLERIVVTKSGTDLTDKFKETFAEKYVIKKEEKKNIVDKVYNQKENGEMKLITETIEDVQI